MEIQTLHAQERDLGGKGPARRLRAQDLVPAVFYGNQIEPRSLSVSPKELSKILSTEFGRNALIKLDFEKGGEELAMVKDLQVHPVKRSLVHVDFYRVEAELPVRVDVPFRTVGKAAGVVQGGEMQVVFRALPIQAKPHQIPPYIEVDVSELELNQAIHVKDLQLGEHVQVLLAPARTLVLVQTERQRPEEEAAVGAAGAAEAGAAAAGTPDAKSGAKAPEAK
ncbi:MAG: 50S ribosomal protein L25 [Myxococcales bacterium]|nr:50S ribosomal protein L25 [Myxococcales bacterium]MCB9709505.1 50S ribosomal protein L25 [Myxococcales bacterium]